MIAVTALGCLAKKPKLWCLGDLVVHCFSEMLRIVDKVGKVLYDCMIVLRTKLTCTSVAIFSWVHPYVESTTIIIL